MLAFISIAIIAVNQLTIIFEHPPSLSLQDLLPSYGSPAEVSREVAKASSAVPYLGTGFVALLP